jgi:thioredoxin-like negative regulator of GroEL
MIKILDVKTIEAPNGDKIIKSKKDIEKLDKEIKAINDAAEQALKHPKKYGLLVKIYADWCGHCKNMAEDWAALTKLLTTEYECKNSNCTLTVANIQVNSPDENDEIMSRLKHIPKDIEGVPSIMYVSSGKRDAEFKGNRNFEDMKNWILNHPIFELKKRQTLPHQVDAKTNNTKTIRRIIKNAKPQFKEFHRRTLRRFHRKMRNHNKSVNDRIQTPARPPHVPAYLVK